VVLDGDPLDPRTRVERVYVEGERVLEASEGTIAAPKRTSVPR